ncbi:hypothetical protein [Desulfonauticus submarinus]
MRILTINCSLNLKFSKVGKVFSVNLPGGIIDLAKYPGALEFKPELIFHQENLGPRTLLIGLDKFHCLKVFWSIDTHLNFLLKVESLLSLLEPNNWRLNLDLVLTNLKNFPLKEAEEELYLAYENAKKHGEDGLFWLRKKAILGEFEKEFSYLGMEKCKEVIKC